MTQQMEVVEQIVQILRSNYKNPADAMIQDGEAIAACGRALAQIEEVESQRKVLEAVAALYGIKVK